MENGIEKVQCSHILFEKWDYGEYNNKILLINASENLVSLSFINDSKWLEEDFHETKNSICFFLNTIAYENQVLASTFSDFKNMCLSAKNAFD